MNIKTYISTIIFLISLIQFTSGQSILETRIIELQEGLKEREVINVERDASGFFYLTTRNYIQRWDGTQFVDIDISSLSSKSLLASSNLELINRSNLVLLVEDTIQELYEIDIQKRVLIPVTPNWNQNSRILHSAGSLYLTDITSDSTSISKLDEKYNPVHIATISDSIEINSISVLPQRIIVQSSTQEVYSYILSSNLIIKHNEKGYLIASETQNTVLADSTKIYHFKNGKWNALDSITKEGFKYTYSNYDQTGRIALGYTNSERHIKSLKLVSNEGNIIPYDFALEPNKRIHDIYADDYLDKTMFATYNGLYYHKIDNGEIKRFKQKINVKKGNFGNIINAVTHDNDGNVYFASEGSGLYQYNSEKDTVTTILERNEGDYFKGTLKLLFDTLTQTLWSTGYNKNESDIYSYNTQTKKFNKYPLDFLANDFIFLDEDHFLLAGRVNQKQPNGKTKYIPRLSIYNFKDHTQRENKLLEDTKHVKPRSVFPYKDYMFIATTTGLVITDRSMSKILKVIDEETTKDNIALKANWIVFIKPYKDKLMVGTNGDGFFMLDPNTLEPSNKINVDNGLSDNVAVSMEVDSFGNAWVTSFMGINIFNTDYEIIKTVYEHDGLSAREFNSTANTSLSGNMFFGTANGITIINPVAFLNKKQSQGQYIEEINLTYIDSTIFKLNNNSNIINIKDDVATIDIHFQFPNYFTYPVENPIDDIQFYGNSEYSVKDNSISIPVNSTGSFIDTITNNLVSETKYLTINVNKKIPWTTLIIVAFTIGFAFFISRFFIRKNKEREEEKTKYNKKIAELKLNALKAQMNPHFIFNSLGAIQYFIQTQDTGKADEYLSKFAKLMRLILESSKNEYINIKDEMKLMELYADLEYVRFEGLFDYVVEIDNDVDTDLPLPPMIVQPLVENAINHGLYNLKDRKGLLEILTTSPSDDKIKIIIRDNGVGRGFRSQSKKPNHKSRGMGILKERISIINSSNDMHVDLHVNDLDQIGDENGTEVVIDIEYFH